MYFGFPTEMSRMVPGPKTSPIPFPWSAETWGTDVPFGAQSLMAEPYLC